MQLRKESLKKFRLAGIRTLTSKKTNRELVIKLVRNIYPGKMKMKLGIYETHIYELRNEEISVKKNLAVINTTYAVAKRKPEKIQAFLVRLS